VEIPLTARVYYLDGNLLGINATTRYDPDEPEAFLPNFRIRIEPGRTEDCMILAGQSETTVSEMYGVAVTERRSHFEQEGTPYGGIPASIVTFMAEFILDDYLYFVSLRSVRPPDYDWDKDLMQTRMTDMVTQLIQGGTAGISVLLDPDLPELRSEEISLEEARLDPDFGAFAPRNIPSELKFVFAHRWVGQHQDYLHLEWETPLDYDNLRALYQRWVTEHEGIALWSFEEIFWQGGTVRWNISKVTEDELGRIVSADTPELYDWSRWPDVEAIWQHYESGITYTMLNPVFLAEELTLAKVQARTHRRDLSRQIMCGSLADEPFGYIPTKEIEFSVLFGDILVHITAQDISAEQIWGMLVGLL